MSARKGPGRPRGIPQSPEARAKISAAVRARWAGDERESLLACARAGLARARELHPELVRKTRPEPGSPERRLFNKIAVQLGAQAAHAELRRGA